MNIRTANDTAVKRIAERLVNHQEILQVPCPYHGIAYSKVPGYVEGYGCPVCLGIGASHLPVSSEQLRDLPLDTTCECGARISHVAGVWIHSETPPIMCFFASPQPATKQESKE